MMMREANVSYGTPSAVITSFALCFALLARRMEPAFACSPIGTNSTGDGFLRQIWGAVGRLSHASEIKHVEMRTAINLEMHVGTSGLLVVS
jgi:hypothetical protein